MSIDEEDIERRADAIIRELDEFCALASDPKTVWIVDREKVAIGQIQTRCQLILSRIGPNREPRTAAGSLD